MSTTPGVVLSLGEVVQVGNFALARVVFRLGPPENNVDHFVFLSVILVDSFSRTFDLKTQLFN
jgi:hypothetical protein